MGDYGGGYGGYGGDTGGYGAGGGGYGGGDYGDYGNHDGGATVAPPKEFHSIAEIKDFLSETDIESTVIGYFDLETNAEDKRIFDEVLSALHTHTPTITPHPSLLLSSPLLLWVCG
jgi:hypothetical protein